MSQHYTNRYAFTRSYHREIHARKRARQRYAIDLHPALLAKIAQAIRDDRATPLGRDVYTVSLPTLDATLPDITVFVAFDPWRDEIASILPPDWTVERAERHDAAHHRSPVSAPQPSTKAFPSAHVLPQRDLEVMSLEGAEVWRTTLVEANDTATTAIDRTAIQKMIVKVNARLKHLKRIAREEKEGREAKAKAARKLAKQDAHQKKVADEAKLQDSFKRMWASAFPDQLNIDISPDERA